LTAVLGLDYECPDISDKAPIWGYYGARSAFDSVEILKVNWPAGIGPGKPLNRPALKGALSGGIDSSQYRQRN
jgi:hypothetical protein